MCGRGAVCGHSAAESAAETISWLSRVVSTLGQPPKIPWSCKNPAFFSSDDLCESARREDPAVPPEPSPVDRAHHPKIPSASAFFLLCKPPSTALFDPIILRFSSRK